MIFVRYKSGPTPARRDSRVTALPPGIPMPRCARKALNQDAGEIRNKKTFKPWIPTDDDGKPVTTAIDMAAKEAAEKEKVG